MTDSTATVGIIILNWNGYADTADCLRSLRGQRYENARIYLIDNASADNEGRRLAIEFPEVVLLQNDANLGFTGGNNVGIQRALADVVQYVLLLNNDTTVAPDFLTKLVAFLESHPRAGIAGSKIFYHGTDTIWFAGGYVQYWTGFARHMAKGIPNARFLRRRPYEVPFITGCSLLIRREVVETVGPLYEPYFAYFEDADWCFNARRAGWSSWLVPTSVLWHKKSGSGNTRGTNRLSSTQAYYQARNAFIFARRQLRGWRRVVFLIAQWTVRLGINMIYARGWQSRRHYFRGLADGGST